LKNTKLISKRALIVAHYNKLGKVRNDTIELLNTAQYYFKHIIFVSTNLDNSEISKFPDFVTLNIRENIGYDFYSYRLGIEMLQINTNEWELLDSITILNTSFTVINSKFFLESYLNNEKKYNDGILGLITSYEIATHLQSYLLTFSKQLINDSRFIEWWKKMEPISNRQEVINNYEIGLSQFVISLDFKLNCAYKLNYFDKIEYRIKIKLNLILKRLNENMSKYIFGNIKNPSCNYLFQLLHNFSIIKLETLKNAPFNLNYQVLKFLILQNRKYKKLYEQCLEN
jgi:rhamnosyltransferase